MNAKQKDNKTAEKLRVSGNEQYKAGNYFFALANYNHSLCYAEPESEQYGFACGNLSAVYFELKQFDLCLQNIQRVKLTKYPQIKMGKLNEREEKCKELMKTSKPNPDDDPFNFFKLSHPAKKTYPGIAECIELRNNKKFGKHLITMKTLMPGDVIAIEEPSFVRAFSCARLYRCSYCCKDALLHLTPCQKCAKAMFCTAECCLDALCESHLLECNPETDPQDDLEIPTTMRMFLKYLNVFDGNVLELKKFLETFKRPVTVFDFNFSDPTHPMYQKRMMLVELSLRNDSKTLTPKDKIENNAFINRHPHLKELWHQHGLFLNELLEKLSGPVSCTNNILISSSQSINQPAESEFEMMSVKNCRRDDQVRVEIGGVGIYPALALASVSCNPNVAFISVGNKIVCIALKRIHRSLQLFRSFSPFWLEGPAVDRQKRIEEDFGYKCDCKACTQDWPTMMGLQVVDSSFAYQDSQTHQQAKSNVKFCADYVTEKYEIDPKHSVYFCINRMIIESMTLAKPTFFP